MESREKILEAIRGTDSLLPCDHPIRLMIAILNGLETEEIIEWFRCCTSVLSSRVNGWDNPLKAMELIGEDYTVQHDQFLAGCLDVAEAHLYSVQRGTKDFTNETHDS